MAKKRTQLLALIDPALVKMLKRKLITDELTYRRWLEIRIAEYVGKNISPSKTRRRKRDG